MGLVYSIYGWKSQNSNSLKDQCSAMAVNDLVTLLSGVEVSQSATTVPQRIILTTIASTKTSHHNTTVETVREIILFSLTYVQYTLKR